jgi:C1A family cysteine protease
MSIICKHTFNTPDSRDYKYQGIPLNAPMPTLYQIPIVKLGTVPINDQGSLGSCLANAVNSLFYIMSSGKITLSRLQLYMCYRAEDGSSLTEDSGGSIRGSMKAIKNYGICNEFIWKYVISNYSKLSPSTAFKSIYSITDFSYLFLSNDLNLIKNALISNNPVLIGIRVYSTFQTASNAKTGIIPMPDTTKEKLLGGHAILLVGYSDTNKLFKFQNSWGIGWGDKGYGYLPYNYVSTKFLTPDLCTIKFNFNF